ncbi:GTPase [Pengzhenrongella sicca]|uniref:50S ribosome-binding GTPase n=1 Tax=Pengzhenrongella sicca TaxID=2819238 RepID=A0A8A4ZHI4_9MICO|nr:GTPase [Pengzhenrongella sicca]QTE30439.1 50S ribosome-binding GTPase [Pengzhenrongella sicca]
MSPRGPDLAVRVTALEEAIAAGTGRLDAADLDRARDAVGHIRERLDLSPEHTVAALAGSTGSGKSSLLNALAGEELAEVGVRRPTTGHPVAAVWGSAGAAPLLDWLGVDERRYLETAGPVPPGLVLIDLPDHDSVVVEHRLRAERLLDRVDLYVWVADPQKYADAALHEQYLRPLAGHGAVVVLVLNQVDRLTPAERDRCVADLRRLAVQDGLRRVRVLPVSARTGEGIDALRALLVDAAQRRAAATARLTADLRVEATRLADACGDGMPTRARRAARDELVGALEEAAGVGVVVDAVRVSAARRARAATGWPPTRWLTRLRSDPLRRLHLDRPAARPELARTSLVTPGPAARARAAIAVRAYTDAATAGAPDAWVLAARERAAAADLPDALDQAVAGTPLDAERHPRWWRAVGAVQWVLLATLAAGLVWLTALAAAAYLGLPDATTPTWSGLPVPTVLAVGGALAGILLALGARLVGGVVARRRAARARVRLRAAVARVADEFLVGPVDAEMGALDRCRAGARMAAA